ncbi:thiamine transport system substrate-binding protein [Micrococcales bacterium KH10]|nr:thiamine transport system substrate-binding protein [Micrococcales bacterium KH10]
MSRIKNPFSVNRVATASIATGLALVLTACGGGTDSPTPNDVATNTEGQSEELSGEVTLIAHDSFTFPDELIADFEEKTGLTLNVTTTGDGGQLANQLVLTKDAPLADAFFGVDNSFVTGLIEAGAVDPYTPESLGESATEFAADDAGSVTPVDHGYVCFNADDAWFEENGLAAPETLDDLTDEAYRGLTVVMDPTASSPGAAMLFATVAKFGEDGYRDYWTKLLANDTKVVQGWSDAYYVDFSGGGEDGQYPIVVSYNTSPAYTVAEGSDESTTSVLLDTCTRQVEYAGVLAGAKNPAGARAVIDYLVSQDFQDTVAETMYMYPVLPSGAVPDEWQNWAPVPQHSLDLAPDQITANRAAWLDEWSQLAG